MTVPTPDAMPDEVLEAMAEAMIQSSGFAHFANYLIKDNIRELRAALTAAASMGWCMRDIRCTAEDERFIAFLEEAAKYFAKRDEAGEDSSFWANVLNSEACLKIAARLRELTAKQEHGG